MRAWLASGAEILKAMTEEETNELLASLAPPAPAPVEVIALADHAPEGADNVAKAGATHSAATKAKLKAVQDALDKCQECMKAFDTESDDNKPAAKLDTPAPDADTVAKFAEPSTDTVAKFAALIDQVSKISAERDSLKDTVTKLEGEAVKNQAALDEIVKTMETKGYLLKPEKGKEGDVSKAAGVEAESADPLVVMKRTLTAS
jgi:hypothetical protein